MRRPIDFTAGNAVTWSQPVTELNHTYEYLFIGAAGRFKVSPTIEGGELVVSLNSSATTAHVAGEYHWFLFSTFNENRHQVADGYITISDDPTKQNSVDTSTYASRVLASIEKRIEGRILTDHENYAVDGRSLTRIPFAQLEGLRNKYAWMVRDEKVRKGKLTKHRRVKFR
ncbi:hypothetical protein P4S73_04695 [Paraglaciecola sp. Hal342]|jgi:hypothetical protein